MKNSKQKIALAVLMVFLMSVMVTGCGKSKTADTPQAGTEKIKVGFVYIGSPGDAGWTYAHDQGRKYLIEKMGDKVDASYVVENVPEGADAERVITELCEKGVKIIFGTTFGYMDYMVNVAAKYPDVTFMHCSGFKTADNLGTYFGRDYQARYLSGIVAGKMTKTGKIGYVAAMPIPECVRGINGFTQGVRSVNPTATVQVVWTNTWYDPAVEKDAAKSLLDKGVDVMAQHQDTPAPLQAAQEKGVYALGYNSDMKKFAPDIYLTSPVWNWGPYYVETVESVLAGTWKSGQYWGGLNEGIIGLGPYGDSVPQDVKDLVAAKEKEIKAGTWDVFTGEVKDQTGAVKVPAGQKMSDQDMLNFNWFVQGVEGTIPKS